MKALKLSVWSFWDVDVSLQIDDPEVPGHPLLLDYFFDF